MLTSLVWVRPRIQRVTEFFDSKVQPGLRATVTAEGPYFLIYQCYIPNESSACVTLLDMFSITVTHSLAVHPWKGHLKSTSLSFFFSKIGVVITLEGHCGDLNKIYKVTRAMFSTQQNRNCCKGWWAWPYFAHLEVELDHLWVWWWCYHAGFEWEFQLSLCYWPTGGAWVR